MLGWRYQVNSAIGSAAGAEAIGGSGPVAYEKNRFDKQARNRRGERGAGRFKALLVTAIIAFGIYAAVKLVPPYVAEYQLADKMQETARFATVSNYTEDQIREQIYKTVEELDIPVTKDQIKITAGRPVVKISVDYTVPVNLLIFQTTLHFTPSAENHSLT